MSDTETLGHINSLNSIHVSSTLKFNEAFSCICSNSILGIAFLNFELRDVSGEAFNVKALRLTNRKEQPFRQN